MSIRRAEYKDIEGILLLLKQVNNVHADIRDDLFIHDKTKYTQDELEGIICDPVTPVFVYADDEDNVIGYAFTQFKRTIGQNNIKDQVELYIDDICFDEKERGKGYAKEIYDEVINFAKKNACDRVTLHVWEGNRPALRFYEKCGMKPYYYAMETLLN
ncbi:MAG: GNAT family N-acetyltransferase [Eubacterium sp.]|nr:GNAT family N-acetyltransferase [Eubacterium sp.]